MGNCKCHTVIVRTNYNSSGIIVYIKSIDWYGYELRVW